MEEKMPKKEQKIEIINSFVALFDECVLVYQYNNKTPIYYTAIKKTWIVKKRQLITNIFFMLVVLINCILIMNFTFEMIIYKIVMVIVTVVLTLLSFKFKKYKYTFIIKKKQANLSQYL